MNILQQLQLIQGGMGVYVSNWRLARAVACARPGTTAGTVSGTALDIVYVRLLQLGDPGGHARRALAAFDRLFDLDLGQRIIDRYFIEGGKAPGVPFKDPPRQTIHADHGATRIALATAEPTTVPLNLDPTVIELLVVTGFVEVWLAKEGHTGTVFINFLNKIELPLLYVLYGAMLAGVDGVIVGAGNPDGLPALCSRLASHQPVTRTVAVLYQEAGETFSLTFDPRELCGGAFVRHPLKRPAFLAIVTLHNLAAALAASVSEPPDGFIIENHTAGGHNANPVGPLRRDGSGQPIYGEGDAIDLAAISRLGLPFWLAGGYGSSAGLREAQAAGARGVQVGSAFAMAEESGLQPDYRSAVLKALQSGVDDETLVRTTLVSPTGFAFKVVQLNGTLAEEAVFASRRRICDIGILRQVGLSKPSNGGTRTLFQRCPAGPIEGYVNKRGLAHNTEGRRCLCNGLLASVGLGQIQALHGQPSEEPAIITLGDHLDGIRRLSRNGQVHYWAEDTVADILGPP